MTDEIGALLGQRSPFVFVDEIVARTPGTSAEALWTSPPSPWPTVLLLEAIAQTAGLALGGTGLLATITHATVDPNPPTNAQITLRARILRSRNAFVEIEGTAHREHHELASARLTLKRQG